MSERRLTLGEREEISLGVGRGEGPRAIGRLLGRPASMVSRGLQRSTRDGGAYRERGSVPEADWDADLAATLSGVGAEIEEERVLDILLHDVRR